MAKYRYSTKIGEKDAAAVGRSLPISTKQAIEICSFIRGRRLENAKEMLGSAASGRTAVPFKRFTDGVGHKKGKIASGRHPKKACSLILGLVDSAQANAQFKGLGNEDLVVRHISAQKAAGAWHYGRRRTKAKRTTVEVVLSEVGQEKKAKKREKAAEPGKKEEKKGAKEGKKEAPKEGKEDLKKEAPKKEGAQAKKEMPEKEEAQEKKYAKIGEGKAGQ